MVSTRCSLLTTRKVCRQHRGTTARRHDGSMIAFKRVSLACATTTTDFSRTHTQAHFFRFVRLYLLPGWCAMSSRVLQVLSLGRRVVMPRVCVARLGGSKTALGIGDCRLLFTPEYPCALRRKRNVRGTLACRTFGFALRVTRYRRFNSDFGNGGGCATSHVERWSAA